MSANVRKDGTVKQLDRRAEADERVTPEQFEDRPRMARLLTDILRSLADLHRLWRSRRIDFEDRTAAGDSVTIIRMQHGFGGRVRWWPVDWTSTTGTAGPAFSRHESSDNDTLCLISHTAGVATIRIELGG